MMFKAVLISLSFLILVNSGAKELYKGKAEVNNKLIADQSIGMFIFKYKQKNQMGKLVDYSFVTNKEMFRRRLSHVYHSSSMTKNEYSEILNSFLNYEKTMLKRTLQLVNYSSDIVEETSEVEEDIPCAVVVELPKALPKQTSYEVEVSPAMWGHIKKFFKTENKSILSFGRHIGFSTEVVSMNDNIFLGGARALKITNDKTDGNDHGKSLNVFIKHLANFEDGSIAVKFFTNLYSKKIERNNIYDHIKYQDSDKYKHQNSLSVEGVEVDLVKDFANKKSFIRFRVQAGRERDKDGLAAKLQNAYHREIQNIGYAPVSINLDHRENKKFINATLGIGKKFTLYNNGKVKITNEAEFGVNLSNLENHRSLYGRGNMGLSYKRFELTGEISGTTKKDYSISAGIGYTLYKTKNSRLSFENKVEFFEDPYTNGNNPNHYSGRKKFGAEMNHHMGFKYHRNF